MVETCDANNDGFIDMDEFKNLYREAWSAYIGALFKTYDLNKDGLITQVKMHFFFKQIPLAPIHKAMII